MGYSIPADCAEAEYEIKKSRFVNYSKHCNNEQSFKDFLTNIRKLHPKASHHCYAFQLGSPQDSRTQGASDDGEPSGTAGQPMLKALLGHRVQGNEIGQIAVIIARYFGGIKLGTGGLARAYTQGVKEVLAVTPFIEFVPLRHHWLTCPYEMEPVIRDFCTQQMGDVVTVTYTHEVKLEVALPEQLTKAFLDAALPYPCKRVKETEDNI